MPAKLRRTSFGRYKDNHLVGDLLMWLDCVDGGTIEFENLRVRLSVGCVDNVDHFFVNRTWIEVDGLV